MVIKRGKFGEFLACPGYPECKNAKPIVNSIKEPCPHCGGKVLVRKSKAKKTFYVCENNTNDENKKCDYISWNKPGAPEKKFVRKAKNKLKQKDDMKIIGITGSFGKTSTKYIVNTIRNFVEMMTKNDTKNETFYHYYKELIKGETNEFDTIDNQHNHTSSTTNVQKRI